MSSTQWKHYEAEQTKLTTHCCPDTPLRTYDVPDVNQAALLRRMELDRLQRKGAR